MYRIIRFTERKILLFSNFCLILIKSVKELKITNIYLAKSEIAIWLSPNTSRTKDRKYLYLADT